MNSNAIKFEDLYSNMYSKVLQYVSYRITDYNQAKDITGDIFLKIYQKMSSFNPEKAAINTWAWTVVKNSLIDHFRIKKLNSINLSKMTTEDGDQLEFPSSSDTFSEVSSNETMARIMSAIDELPASHREIVYLNLVEDLNYKDVASRTNTPLGTVKGNLAKAKRILANKLNDLA